MFDKKEPQSGETEMFERIDLSTSGERQRYYDLLAEAQMKLQAHLTAKRQAEEERTAQARAFLRS